jgi:hypothetical protein
MNKTLLDEFAMAALAGWVSTLEPDATVNCETVAASLYDLAGAMMAERAKRMPAPTPEPDHQDERQPSFRARVLCQVEKMKGSRVTCTQVFQAIAGPDDRSSLWALQQIGGILRQLGFKRARSGGKDYYQL